MARDYASQKNSKKKKTFRRARSTQRSWLWRLKLGAALIGIVLLISLGVWIMYPQTNTPHTKHAPQRHAPIQIATPVDLFYQETHPVHPVFSITFQPTPPSSKPVHIWLEYGLYAQDDPALTAEIMQLEQKNITFQKIRVRQQGKIWYRLESGPFSTTDDALTQQLILLNQKINAIVRQTS